jgi:hypothetical protein
VGDPLETAALKAIRWQVDKTSGVCSPKPTKASAGHSTHETTPTSAKTVAPFVPSYLTFVGALLFDLVSVGQHSILSLTDWIRKSPWLCDIILHPNFSA